MAKMFLYKINPVLTTDLVLLAWSLAILCESLQGLGDQLHVVLVDVKAQKTQPSCCTATHDVQKLECLTHQVIVCFIVLTAKKILERKLGNF